MITNALSVDVEEYYHAEIFRRGVHSTRRPNFESRVERNTEVLLELLREHGARATFFVLGEIAKRHSAMVRRLAAENHEIACHGDRHDNVWRQSPQAFRADIRRAKLRIEDAVGLAVIGYRAPNFSIRRAQQAWAYQILLEEGFRYDSSVFPIVHDRYGQPDAPRFAHEVWRNTGGGLMEFPISTVRFVGVNLPIGGGGYFRLLPLALTTLGIHHVNAREGRPVMFYLHPWELDPDQPRQKMAWHNRVRHYAGLARQVGKLSRLFARFSFGPACEVLQLDTPPLAHLAMRDNRRRRVTLQ
jgi:polysaccharide deacetylase family protein (PEP-CTERM system associated)